MMCLQSYALVLPARSALHPPGSGMRRAEAPPHERQTGVQGPVSAPVSVHQPDAPPGDMPLADWGALLNAVTERLHRLTEAAPPPLAGLGTPLRECVDALRQLNDRLDARLLDATALGAELAAAQAELAVTRAELARAQPGRQHAQHQAMHDTLTQLPNRSHFQQRLVGILAGADGAHASLAVLHLDLDSFKRINDAHGHGAGDAALCIVAQRLARALRVEDTVCRLGGDTFACLLVAPASREQLSKLACKLYDAVAAPLQVGALKLSVQPSIGIAMYPDDGLTGDTLLQRADAAMCRAKRGQQGYAFFEKRSDL
jgi:diguanylate cyclase (GGDEF)-like protein